MHEHKLGDAEALLQSIYASRVRVQGADHADTLETLASLSDLQVRLRFKITIIFHKLS